MGERVLPGLAAGGSGACCLVSGEPSQVRPRGPFEDGA